MLAPGHFKSPVVPGRETRRSSSSGVDATCAFAFERHMRAQWACWVSMAAGRVSGLSPVRKVEVSVASNDSWRWRRCCGNRRHCRRQNASSLGDRLLRAMLRKRPLCGGRTNSRPRLHITLKESCPAHQKQQLLVLLLGSHSFLCAHLCSIILVLGRNSAGTALRISASQTLVRGLTTS